MTAWPKSSTVGKDGQPEVSASFWNPRVVVGVFLLLMLLLLATFHPLDLESIYTPLPS